MAGSATNQLLDRFCQAVGSALPVVSAWAHGSLAGGDYQPGRSDLDLIVIVPRRSTTVDEEQIRDLHQQLAKMSPLTAKLHCSYASATELDDPSMPHLTWAHEELMSRPITPVTRRELHDFGLVLSGRPPAGLLPVTSDAELARFVVRDLGSFWLPALDHPERWNRDVWVDLGLLTLARACVTLRSGRLITKGEALDVLTEAGAPPELVDDIRKRRYGDPPPPSAPWIRHRATLARTFLRPAIQQVVADYPER